MKNILTGSVAAALLLFIWSMLSWTMLDWHKESFLSFKDEKAVSTVIRANAPESGVYILPNIHRENKEVADIDAGVAEESSSLMETGPLVFGTVYLSGMGSMFPYMMLSLMINFLSAFLVACLLSTTGDLRYFGKVGFVMIFALAASVACHLPYWNWWHFPMSYTAIAFADMLIGWYFAALALAWFV